LAARLVRLANEYIQGASRKDESNKPSWPDTVAELKRIAPKICENIKSLIDSAEEADLKAENEKNKAAAKIKAVGFLLTSVLHRSP